MKRGRRVCGAALVSLIAASCYPTTIRSGRPALPSSETTYWHHAFVFGLVEASGPYPLDAICPDGWSEFYGEMTAFHGILRIVTLGLYAPAKVHVVCAALPGVDVNSMSEGPLRELELGTRGRGPDRAQDPSDDVAPPDAGLPDAGARTEP